MSKFPLVVKLLSSTAFTMTLMVAVFVLYPLRTPAQAGEDTTPQPGCLSGYPNGTYQGARPVTRNEFAAGLNACLNQVNKLIPFNKSSLATRADFEVLINRQRQLNIQLRELNGRLGNLSGSQ